MLKRIVVLAAMALVVLAAIPAQAQSRRYQRDSRCNRYDRYGRCTGYGNRQWAPPEGWLNYGVQRNRDLVNDLWDGHDRAMSDIDNRYPRNTRRAVRADRYNPMPVRRVPLLTYVMGRRGPADSCLYSWNSRSRCHDYQRIHDDIKFGVRTAETIWLLAELHKLNQNMANANRQQQLAAIDDTYGTEERDEEVVDREPRQEEPVQQVREERPAPRHTELSDTTPKPITILNQTGCKVSIDHVEVAINGDTSVTDRSHPPFVEAPATCDKYFKTISTDVIALKCH